MHNLLLGNLRHYCRDVWGLDIKDKASDLSKGYIIAVVEFNGVSPTGTSFSNASDTIKLPPVLDKSTTDFHLNKNPYDISKHCIIDQPTINQIQEDISNTVFPSWMECPPRNFGSPSHGKLKADQWRMVGTVSLVITLSKLLLNNFIMLICMVDLTIHHSMDPDHMNQFDSYMLHYLKTLHYVFRHQLISNHNLSLHLRQCLLLFGPVHAWWTFPFKHYNGILQQLNTNSETEQMLLTFMCYFHIGSTLRWLMETIKWPTSLLFKKMASAYHDTVKLVRAAGLRIADFLLFGEGAAPDNVPLQWHYDKKKEVDLPRRLYDPLFSLISSGSAHPFSSPYTSTNPGAPTLPYQVNNIRSIDHNGVTFTMWVTGFCNSFIFLPTHGQITGIFLHSCCENGKVILEMFLHIDEYKSLDPAHIPHDPYRRFPDINTRLFYNIFQTTLQVIRLQDV
ncbi:hypothetical protein V8D89_002299 [Ganoderma adspersum]